ncbi:MULTISPECIES: hypothetical protein [Parachlamydia]|nr:hypothetical protein [Parachlamydia acanthamoebae]
MAKIEENLSEFTQMLEQDKAIRYQNNEWHIEKGAKSFCRRLFRLEQTRMREVAKAFNAFLDQQERIPVVFSTQGVIENKQKEKFEGILKASKEIKKRLQSSNSKKNQGALRALKMRTIALKYRVGKELGGLDLQKAEHIDEQLKDAITEAFKGWKERQTVYSEKAITPTEQNIIRNLCQYPKFVKMLLKDPYQKEECFKRLLRDRYGVQEYIEFYSIYKRMEECLLVGWIGRFGKQLLSVETERDGSIQRKVVTLKVEGKKVNILDEKSSVTFDGHLKVDIKNVLDVFKAKNDDPGNFAIFGPNGVTRFNVHVHDHYNAEKNCYEPIDMTQPNIPWWERYPVFEIVSRQEVSRRHPQAINKEGCATDVAGHLNGGKWLVIEKASKESPGLDLDANHGYLDIYIPAGPDHYMLVPIGKFASQFPKGFLGRLKFIMGTFEGKIAYGDENQCYSRRQQASVPYLVEEDLGKKLMELIRQDILLSREGFLIFQFPWENCSHWAHFKLKAALGKKIIVNHYKLSILKITPSNPLLKKLVKGVSRTPKKIHPPLIKFVLFFFGSFRKKETMEKGELTEKSMSRVFKQSTGEEVEIYLPGNLHEKIKEGSIVGTLSVGPFVQP